MKTLIDQGGLPKLHCDSSYLVVYCYSHKSQKLTYSQKPRRLTLQCCMHIFPFGTTSQSLPDPPYHVECFCDMRQMDLKRIQ